MLGIILIYFIGKWHYELADLHKRNKWLFAILGVLSYYAGTFVFGLLFGVYVLISNDPELLNTNNFLLNLIALPFGLLATWGQYKLLESNWKKNKKESFSSELLDDQQQNDINL